MVDGGPWRDRGLMVVVGILLFLSFLEPVLIDSETTLRPMRGFSNQQQILF